MTRTTRICLVILMVGILAPVFAFDDARFAKVLQTAANADDYLYSLMEPGLSKTSPEFQAALAAQKKARSALGNEVNALETREELGTALAVAQSFSAQSGSCRTIGQLAESLIASRLEFVTAHLSTSPAAR